jgi:hypothetical protein
MIPPFDRSGNLPPGVHSAEWVEIISHYGVTSRLHTLLAGLRDALRNLQNAGCPLAYIDGSFVTIKPEPGDYDVCWAIAGVTPELLDPVLLDFSDGRAAQKARYGGELFPAELPEKDSGRTFLEFFQTDRETGKPKGIIVLDLETLDLTEEA